MVRLARLLWPVPLLFVGILGHASSILTGLALVLALFPLVMPHVALGRPLGRMTIGKPLSLFVVSALVGFWASYDRDMSLPMLLTILGSVSLFVVIANATASPRLIAGGLTLLGALAAFYFVSQYAHLNYQDEVGLLAQLGRLTSSFFPAMVFARPHPNAVATFLEGAFLPGLVLFRRARGGWRAAWGATLLLILYGLLISGSRGAWLGLATALVLWATLSTGGRWLQVGGVVFGLAVGIGLGTYIVLRLASPGQHILLLSSAFDAADSRFTLYRNSLHLLGDYPFTGVGLGSVFAMVYSRYQLLINVPYLYYAHNLFLAVWLGQGLLGLIALVWLMVNFYRLVVQVEHVATGHSQALFRASWIGVTATFVHGLLDSSQFSADHWTMPMLFALLGLTVVLGRRELRRYAVVPAGGWGGQIPLRWRWGAAAGLALATVIALAAFMRPLTVDWLVNLGALYHTRADLSPDAILMPRSVALFRAKKYFQRTLELDPMQPVANRRLGMMALDDGDFETAVTHLEAAFTRDPHNQATLKALGYAYLWTGQVEQATGVFQQVDFKSRLVNELGYWQWWWGTQNREDLAMLAEEMRQRLQGGENTTAVSK